MSKILDTLWLGNAKNALDTSFISTNNITVVVNCTKDIPFISSIPFKYRIPVNDDLQPQSFQEMYVAMCYIIPILAKHIDNGDNILIHCYAGMQRSAIVTLGLLTELTYKSVFKDVVPNDESINQYCNNLTRYLSSCRSIVFTPEMNFKDSYLHWLNTYITTLDI